MQISTKQMQTFQEGARDSFEKRLLAVLQGIAPKMCLLLGDNDLRTIIRQGTERAAGYGILTERNVARYILVMLRIGNEFDTNPATSWSRPILLDEEPDELKKLVKLQFTAKRFGYDVAELA